MNTPKYMISIFFLGLGFITGCTQVKKEMGITKTEPNCFTVDPPNPLEIPPDLTATPPGEYTPKPCQKRIPKAPLKGAEKALLNQIQGSPKPDASVDSSQKLDSSP